MDPKQFVSWFRNSSPYINAHRGKTFVVLFGGEVVDGENFPGLVHDIALLNSLGVKLLLVHGARPQIESCLEQEKIDSKIVDGLRITDDRVLPVVKAAVGSTRMDIEALLSMGVANSPMAGAKIRVCGGNFVTARPVGVRDGVDFCHTGEVRRIDTEAITRNLDEGNIVLLSPLGYSPTGEIFSLSAEDVATAAAIQLKADKLIFLTDEETLIDSQNKAVHELTLSQLSKQNIDLSSSESEHLASAIRAVKHGVKRAHLINRHTDGAMLQELFTRNGVGSMISADTYDNIRQASIDDVGGILELIEPLEAEGVLVRRSRELLEIEIDRFTIMERDGMIIGCCALYPFPDDNMAELACLVIHPDYRKAGRADALFRMAERLAVNNGVEKLFVLSSQTAHWFLERGFKEATLENLPMGKQTLYNFQRRSKIFIKDIDTQPPVA